MSWGERSCIYYGTGNCPNLEISFNTCHPGCKYYKSNGNKTESELAETAVYKVKDDIRIYKKPTKKELKKLKRKGKLK